jgi:hypothetical protein
LGIYIATKDAAVTLIDMRQKKTHLRNAGYALAVCTAITLGLGQACGPGFTVPSQLSSGSNGATGFLSEAEKQACAPTGTLPPIESISTLVSFINSLPRPVQLHCVVANLPRPLFVLASQSASSAQPSLSAHDPRIFIKSGSTILTLITSGAATGTLEFSQAAGSDLWERADFRFPVAEAELREQTGLDHIRFGSGTSCGLCHAGEVYSRTLDGSSVYKSQLMRPAASQEVSIGALRSEVADCQKNSDQTDRCLLFRSLFEGGAVVPFVY